ncbi:cupin domain-containing protein [uncultured Draconibacterium sp.]|uniref:cupin domain-containing protein n=1 Tax=uncultured Draconibacterium sp. TaxID=1573823 RepID=UPI002AA83C8B|nr:cupin domain-containing protein [uncultured Draconibacterium sp.]
MASENILKNSKRWEDLGDGVSRQIMGWDNQIMMVKVKFEKGAVGAEHTHFHTQTTYCESGKFEFSMDGKKVVVEPGDGLYIPPNMLHGTVCLEPGILIDVFSPVREDFL